MRPVSGERFWDATDGGITATEDILLLSSTTRTKSDDYPVGTNARPPEPPLVFGSPDATRNTETLDDLFSRPQLPRPASPSQQGSNNAQAQSGGGGVPGGASTPNAGGGGGGGGSSGAGPAVTNASQFLSVYLNMVGSALPPGTVPALATSAASGQPATAATGQPTGAHATAGSLTPTTGATPAQTAPLASSKKQHDPLYVLDMNTGETVPANVTLNTFSSWSENLLAQVSGSAVSSYSWNTTAAPDLTNITGASTANLQGTWTSFTGAARTDTVTVTETPTVGPPVSQTITFLVAGTNSPGYSASRPTSSSTWPSVLTPDVVVAGQAAIAGGPYANLGLADGSVQTSFAMPTYNPGPSSPSTDHAPS